MEQFYKLLRNYNYNLIKKSKQYIPKWFYIYIEKEPPIYFTILYSILKNTDKKLSVIEIGSGLGDILTLLLNLGYKDVIGFEKDKALCELANKKLLYFGGQYKMVKNEYFTGNKNYSADILIQINSVYAETTTTKKEYLEQICKYYNAVKPKIYLLEVIDISYTNKNKIFPEYIRLSKSDIKKIFPNKTIEQFMTYQYPINTSTKCLYKIF